MTPLDPFVLEMAGDAPSSPSGREPPLEPPDDLGWEAPDEDATDARDDENWDPDDDSDLELDDVDESDEIGLDGEAGLEDTADDLELDEAGEGERWTVDSEAADELAGADADVISGEEYGYTGDDESLEPDDDLESELDEPLPNLDDGGVEGVDDESDLDDFELGGLPDLDAGSDEEAEGFGSEALDELAGVNLADEPTIELLPGHPWRLLPQRALRTTQVATLPGPALTLTSSQGRVALCTRDGLFTAGRSALTRLPVEAGQGRAIAMAEEEGRLVFALAAADGLYLSRDAGHSFERVCESDPPSHIGFTQNASSLRLWSRTARGGLLTSDDFGQTWSSVRLEGSVLAFATDGERRVCVLAKRGSRVLLGTSSDAGRRWSWADAADSSADGDAILVPARGASLVATAKRVGFAQAGQSPRAVSAVLQAPAALLDEDDECFVYATAQRDDQLLIVRCSARGAAQPLVIASLSRTRVGEPRQLVASFAEGGFVTLHLATDQLLLRVEASLDGEDMP